MSNLSANSFKTLAFADSLLVWALVTKPIASNIIDIKKAIGGSPELRSKKELIEDFIATINTSTDIQSDWQKYIQQKKIEELDLITKELKLKPEETKTFVENSFRDGELRTTGTDIDKILPSQVSRFGTDLNNRYQLKNQVISKLQKYFDNFFNI